MICVVWEVKSCDRLRAEITEQFSIPNQFSRKHCKANEQLLILVRLWPRKQKRSFLSPPVSPSLYWSTSFDPHLSVWQRHWRRYPLSRESRRVEIGHIAGCLHLLPGPQDGPCYHRFQKGRPLQRCPSPPGSFRQHPKFRFKTFFLQIIKKAEWCD